MHKSLRSLRFCIQLEKTKYWLYQQHRQTFSSWLCSKNDRRRRKIYRRNSDRPKNGLKVRLEFSKIKNMRSIMPGAGNEIAKAIAPDTLNGVQTARRLLTTDRLKTEDQQHWLRVTHVGCCRLQLDLNWCFARLSNHPNSYRGQCGKVANKA
jgi:hypothetical protein